MFLVLCFVLWNAVPIAIGIMINYDLILVQS